MSEDEVEIVEIINNIYDVMFFQFFEFMYIFYIYGRGIFDKFLGMVDGSFDLLVYDQSLDFLWIKCWCFLL